MKYNARVLYVMDGGFSEFETLKQIVDLAEAYRSALTLFDITHTITPPARMMIAAIAPGELRERTLRTRLRQLEALVAMIRHDSCRLRARTSFGKRANEIVSEANQGNYDLVIKRRENGSTDSRVSRDCLCPVWVLQPEDFTDSGAIIAANAPRIVTGSENQSARFCAQGS